MLRRIYILFPEKHHVETAVGDLKSLNIDIRHMHAIARRGVDLKGLPEASVRQRTDQGAKLEQLFWNLNLMLFALFLGLLVLSLLVGAWGWSVASLLVMLVSCLGGYYFASHIPHAHLEGFRSALRHGEILLLVDVPRWKLHLVDSVIRKDHPEATCDAVGWASEMLHT